MRTALSVLSSNGKALLLSTFFLGIPTAFATNRGFHPERCPLALLADYHAPDPDTQDSKIYLLRTHETPYGPVYEVLVVTTYESPGAFRTYVIRRDVRAGRPDVPPQEIERLRQRGITEDKAEKIHFSLIAPVLRENIDKYGQRRENWPKAFHKKLWRIGKDYLNDSIFVVVTRKSGDQVVGAMRLIRAPYGMRDGRPVAEGPVVRNLYGPVSAFRTPEKKTDEHGLPLPPSTLPELDFLGIEPDRPAVTLQGFEDELPSGLLTELGTFFVEETLSAQRGPRTAATALTDSEKQQVWTEWLTALEHVAHEWDDDHFSYYGQSFHFYADPVSQRIYKPFQYTPLRHYRQDGKEVTIGPDEKIPAITKDGVRWVPVVWYLEAIDDYYRRFADGQVPSREQVSPFEVLTRRVAAGTLLNPAIATVLSGEPALTSQTVAWAATEPKLPREVSFGATGILIRQIDLFNMHVGVRLQEGDQTETGKRAEAASRGMQQEVVTALDALRRMRTNPNWIFRHNLARYYNQLLQTAPRRKVFGEKELLRDFIAPSLFDDSPLVRQQTLWSFRELTPERIRQALELDGDPAKARAEAERTLAAKGVPADKSAAAVRALSAALRLPKPAPANEERDTLMRYWEELKPALATLDEVRGYGPEIALPLLTLAALHQ